MTNITNVKFYLSNKDEKPSLMLFMLHGCGGNAEDILKLAPMLDIPKNFVAIAPEAVMPSEEGENSYQWFDIENNYTKELFAKKPSDLDQKERRAYMKMALGDEKTKGLFGISYDLNLILDKCQKEWNITDTNTIILGYSQGGMTAIDLALSRNFKVRKAISVAGAVIPPFEKTLEQRINSNPEIVFIHGNNDDVINFNAAKNSQKILKKLGCKTRLISIANHKHGNQDKAFWNIAAKQISAAINDNNNNVITLMKFNRSCKR
ncbi:MAG: alpha/beta hydrolase [Alphaproteobacteria bacterium]